MPDETPEQRDERVTAENEKRDAERRKTLDAHEAANALRVHLDLGDEPESVPLVTGFVPGEPGQTGE